MKYKRCPNCGNRKFYIESSRGGMVFFWVEADGSLTPTESSRQNGQALATAPKEIFCTSCAWHGSSRDLTDPA